MAKIRKPDSIENGIMEVLKILSEEEIKEAIGKGSSYLRKCSNPDLQQQIDHNDSIKLDIACIKKSKSPPLHDAHEYIITKKLKNFDEHSANDIDAMLVKSTILHGKLTEVVKLAESPLSEKGEKISASEKKDIMDSIRNLEEKIFKIKQTIDKK